MTYIFISHGNIFDEYKIGAIFGPNITNTTNIGFLLERSFRFTLTGICSTNCAVLHSKYDNTTAITRIVLLLLFYSNSNVHFILYNTSF